MTNEEVKELLQKEYDENLTYLTELHKIQRIYQNEVIKFQGYDDAIIKKLTILDLLQKEIDRLSEEI